MVSLPTSSSNNSDSGYSIYQSNGDSSYVEQNQDVRRANMYWDWGIKAHDQVETLRAENEALKNEYAKAQGLADFLTDCEVQHQIDLRVAAAENLALKRSLKLHKIIYVVATLVGVSSLLFKLVL